MAKDNNNTPNNKTPIYTADSKPPFGPLLLSSLQQMLLLLSLGMALPVSIARAAGLDVIKSGALLAAGFFGMGVTSIFQTMKGKFIGSGKQAFAAGDSAAISVCVLAAEAGGVPLVLGMTLFAAVVRFIMGSFAYKLRKLFPPEVTGTMIFILGINLVPTSFKYFFGTYPAGQYDIRHVIVAAATFLFMLVCTLFIKPFKPYSALLGIVFGYILSLATGIFSLSAVSALKDKAVVALPFYTDFSFSFSPSMVIPFLIIAVAAVVDNIGDFSAGQAVDDPTLEKTDWKAIERGIRAGSLGMFATAFIGGTPTATATTNIGISKASGITSRAVAYVASGILIFISFFPGLTGLLSAIPEPVLGAAIMYSMCYIMAGGLSSIASRELNDRKLFAVFLSIAAAISTLIPGLYSFLPDSVSQVIVSPMVMGVVVILALTLLGKIGTKRRHEFNTGVNAADVEELSTQVEKICGEWGTSKLLSQKLRIAMDAIAEGIYELQPDARICFEISYDELQVKVSLNTADGHFSEEMLTNKEDISSMAVALRILPNLFDYSNAKIENGNLVIDLNSDL